MSLPSWVPSQYASLVESSANQYHIRPVLLAALLKQESGFNPTARSVSGAEGIAQFMPGTASGVGLSNPDDPNQAIPAAAKFLSGLIAQFGGNESLGLAAYNAGAGSIINGQIPQNGQTPNYVSSILSMAGAGSSTGIADTSTGVAGQASVPSKPDALTLNGVVLGQALLDSVPDLAKVAKEAADNNYDSVNATAAIMNTTWWKTHSDSTRQWQALFGSDPTTASQALTLAKTRTQQLAAQMGVTLDDKGATNLANMALMLGYTGNHLSPVSDNLIQQFLVPAVKRGKDGNYAGEAGSVQQQVAELARQYGVPMTSSQVDFMVKGALNSTAGDATGDAALVKNNVTDWLKQQAKSLYPGLSKAIDGGMTVLDAASPYITTMAKDLELPYDGSSSQQTEAFMNDPLLKKALQYKPPATAGGAASTSAEPTTMPLWQFEQATKEDPRWMKTDNARDSLMSTGVQVLKDMGFAPAGG